VWFCHAVISPGLYRISLAERAARRLVTALAKPSGSVVSDRRKAMESEQAEREPAEVRPLSEPQIDAVVRQYLREMARFEKAALYVADRLRREIRAATLKHMVTFRAKHPDELRGKLLKKRADPRYTPERLRDALDSVVTDLAGCRVLLYDPADEERAAEIVRRALPLRTDLDGHIEVHRKPNGYRATHLLVGVPESVDSLSVQNTVCEVQVTTLAAHVFNELEHDVIYKDHGVPPTPAEIEAANALRAAAFLLDHTAAQTLSLRARAIASTRHTINEANELRYALEQATGRALRGDFARLFRLLSSLYEPFTLTALGNVAEHMRFGVARGEALVLDEVDDVVALVLGIFREKRLDFVKKVSSWKGPDSAIKTAILAADAAEKRT
jgi:ppGpp synthetase/RelA/SpoT-type nucleotidyltranferase